MAEILQSYYMNVEKCKKSFAIWHKHIIFVGIN